MVKRIILILFVITSGLLTGYYSGPAYNVVRTGKELLLSGTAVSEDKGRENTVPGSEQKFISGDAAVSAVKNMPWVQTLLKVSELGGTSLSFTPDRQPTEEYPVWQVEVKERYPDRGPDTMYFQVDAISGRVMELLEKDMKISGIYLNMPRKEAQDVCGSPQRTRRKWNNEVKQSLRTDTYQGLEVVYDKNNTAVRVAAFEAAYLGPGQIKVGDSKEEVIKKLGKAAVSQPGLMAYVPVDKKEYQLVIDYDGQGNVTAFTISSGLLE